MPMRIKHPSRMPGGGGTGHLAPVSEEDLLAIKTRPATPPTGEHQPYWAPLPLEETGFINSQPSMAEFMTALPHMGAGGDPVGLGAPPPQLSPQQTPPGYGMDHGHGMGSPGVNVPEYPWMKEKKTTRKSSQQGRDVF